MKFFLAAAILFATTTSVVAHGHHHHHHHGHDHDHDHHHGHWHGVRGLQGRGNGNGPPSGVHPGIGNPNRPETPPGPWSTWADFEAAGARCKSKDPTAEERDASNKLVAKYKKWKANNAGGNGNGRGKNGRVLQTGLITVKTYFHILDKRITQAMIDDQKATLENAYITTGTDFRFDIEVIQYQDSDANAPNYSQYITDAGSDGYDQSNDIDVQTAHRIGGTSTSTLNVYLTELTSGLLGWATLPPGSAGSVSDGVMNLWSSMNGGPSAPYNEGDTLVHEVGHW